MRLKRVSFWVFVFSLIFNNIFIAACFSGETSTKIRNGDVLEHWPDGVVKRRGALKNGIRIGPWELNYSSGKKKAVFNLTEKGDLKKVDVWYESGPKMCEWIGTDDNYYVDSTYWKEDGVKIFEQRMDSKGEVFKVTLNWPNGTPAVVKKMYPVSSGGCGPLYDATIYGLANISSAAKPFYFADRSQLPIGAGGQQCYAESKVLTPELGASFEIPDGLVTLGYFGDPEKVFEELPGRWKFFFTAHCPLMIVDIKNGKIDGTMAGLDFDGQYWWFALMAKEGYVTRLLSSDGPKGCRFLDGSSSRIENLGLDQKLYADIHDVENGKYPETVEGHYKVLADLRGWIKRIR